jgi:hypothetical protein
MLETSPIRHWMALLFCLPTVRLMAGATPAAHGQKAGPEPAQAL